jgi:hypothetical protein
VHHLRTGGRRLDREHRLEHPAPRALLAVAGRLAALCGLLVLLASCAGRNQPAPPAGPVAAGCSARMPSPCEAACFRGDGVACAIFGGALAGTADAPVRLPQDLPRGRKALERGCQLGNLDACLAKMDYDVDAAPAATCAGQESLCARGNQRSCTYFAQCLDHVQEFRRDRPRALQLFEAGCAHGDAPACRELAFLTLSGRGVPRDLARAVSLFDQACRLDDPLACAHLGQQLERGQGVARDLERAKFLYRQACARGIRPIPCEGLRRLGEALPSTVVSSADATESSHVSQRFDYEWRLPANWELVPTDALPLSQAAPDAEVVAARARGGAASDSLIFVVSDFPASDAAKAGDGDPAVLAQLEDQGTAWFMQAGIASTRHARAQFLGNDVVRFEAVIDQPAKRFLSLLLFRKDRRLFELRCLEAQYQPHAPCIDAFGALMIHEPRRDPTEFARVLHLREPRFHLAFDAPDDVWLAFGPHTSENPRATYWTWIDGTGGEIGVTAFEIGGSPGLTTEDLTATLGRSYAARGDTVTTKASLLAGRPCGHLEIDPTSGDRNDTFVQRRGDFGYTVAVWGRKHDPALLARARAGLRIDDAPRP